jgi:hypothetical protein
MRQAGIVKSAAYDSDAYRQARAAMRNAVERDLRIVEVV